MVAITMQSTTRNPRPNESPLVFFPNHSIVSVPQNNTTNPIIKTPNLTQYSSIIARNCGLNHNEPKNSRTIPINNATKSGSVFELLASSAPGAFTVAPTRFRFCGRAFMGGILIVCDTRLLREWLRSYLGNEVIVLTLFSCFLNSPSSYVTSLTVPKHTFLGIK